MKKPLKFILGATLAGSLLVLAGCVLTSVYPYYTGKDVVFEPKLIGLWADADKGKTNEFWEFSRAGTNTAYALTIHDNDKQIKFEVHLFRLKHLIFLDAMPLEEHEEYVPPHYLLKVNRFEPTLDMDPMDYKWVSELLQKKPDALRHIWVGASRMKMKRGGLSLRRVRRSCRNLF
jgi:hypothetical protein